MEGTRQVGRMRENQGQGGVTRRGFLKYLMVAFSAVATVVGVAVPVIGYLWPPKTQAGQAGGRVAVADEADLPVGKGQVFSVANKPVLVIHTPEGFRALSAVCTHLGCIVYWDEGRKVIACPCHAAFFNTNGAVISGPPPSPLSTLRVEVQGGRIYVEGGST